MRGLLALALLQAMLGGGLLMSGVDDGGTLVDDGVIEREDEIPVPGTDPGPAPETPGDAPPPSAPTPGVATTQAPFIPPTAAGDPRGTS